MKFTLVFPSHESKDLSIGCLFTPCLQWVWGAETISVPHPDQPHYLSGDFQELLQTPELVPHLPSEGETILVAIHSEGIGTEDDLQHLLADIQKASYRAKSVFF